jgi:hypothetical protein
MKRRLHIEIKVIKYASISGGQVVLAIFVFMLFLIKKDDRIITQKVYRSYCSIKDTNIICIT